MSLPVFNDGATMMFPVTAANAENRNRTAITGSGRIVLLNPISKPEGQAFNGALQYSDDGGATFVWMDWPFANQDANPEGNDNASHIYYCTEEQALYLAARYTGGFHSFQWTEFFGGRRIFVGGASGTSARIVTSDSEAAPFSLTTRTNTFGTNLINFVAHNGTNLWLAGGSSDSLSTSPDGVTWTSRTSGFSSSSVAGAAFGAGLWVLIADVGSTTHLRTSPDGITWTTRTTGLASSDRLYGVAFGGGLFVVVTSTGKLITSTNGTSWAARTSGFGTAAIRAVAYGDGLWVIVGDGGRVSTSPDGITWTEQTGALDTNTCTQMSYGNGLWVANTTTRLMTSPDGINWTERTVPLISGQFLRRPCYGGGLWTITTDRARIITSEDGITWTDAGNNSFSGGAWAGQVRIARMPDGTNQWTECASVECRHDTQTTIRFAYAPIRQRLFLLASSIRTNSAVTYSAGLVIASTADQGATWSRSALTNIYNLRYHGHIDIVETPFAVLVLGTSWALVSSSHTWEHYVLFSENGTTWGHNNRATLASSSDSNGSSIGFLWDAEGNYVHAMWTVGHSRHLGDTSMATGWGTVTNGAQSRSYNDIFPKGTINDNYHYVLRRSSGQTSNDNIYRSANLTTWENWSTTGLGTTEGRAYRVWIVGNIHYFFCVNGVFSFPAWANNTKSSVTAPVPGQTSYGIHHANGAEILFHSAGISGTNLFKVEGYVTDSVGNPASRVIRFYQRSNWRYMGQVTSDPITGHYELIFKNTNELIAIALANDDAEAEAQNSLTPVVYNDQIARVLPG